MTSSITISISLPLTDDQKAALAALVGMDTTTTGDTEEKPKKTRRTKADKEAEPAADPETAKKALERVTAAVKKGLAAKPAIGVAGVKAVFQKHGAETFVDLDPKHHDAVAEAIEELLMGAS
jgi:hypothetical protein